MSNFNGELMLISSVFHEFLLVNSYCKIKISCRYQMAQFCNRVLSFSKKFVGIEKSEVKDIKKNVQKLELINFQNKSDIKFSTSNVQFVLIEFKNKSIHHLHVIIQTYSVQSKASYKSKFQIHFPIFIYQSYPPLPTDGTAAPIFKRTEGANRPRSRSES